jgi:hypothetical protein
MAFRIEKQAIATMVERIARRMRSVGGGDVLVLTDRN